MKDITYNIPKKERSKGRNVIISDMFLERKGRSRTIVEQWRDRRLDQILAKDHDERIDMLHTAGFLTLFLSHNKGVVDTCDYGEIDSQFIVANILWGINNKEIIFYWKMGLRDGDKVYGIHQAANFIVVRGDQVLTDIDLGKNKLKGENSDLIKEFGISIYNSWRQL